MKIKMSLRLLSLASLAIFLYSLSFTSSALAKESTPSHLVKSSISASSSPASIPCEEKEDSNDSSPEKRNALFSEVSFFGINFRLYLNDHQPCLHLTHVTYCIGNLLYLAHRRVLI